MKLKLYTKKVLLISLLLIGVANTNAQKNFFTKVAPTGKYAIEGSLKSYNIYRLDDAALRGYIAKAPVEFYNDGVAAPIAINVPLPDGTVETFQIFESSILAPQIAAQFPDFKTYAGKSKTSGATIRISFTSAGFDAVITSAGKDAIYFQKANNDIKDNSIISYFGSKTTKLGKPNMSNKCGTLAPATSNVTILGDTKTTFGTQNLTTTGGALRNFKLAVSATAEYNTLKGAGNTATTFSSIVAFVNRLVAVYRSELSITFTLVSGTNLIATTVGTPFTNASSNDLITQNQTFVDNIIGDANYDLAFVLGTSTPNSSSGGLAASSSVGTSAQKAQNAIQVAVDNTFAPVFDDQTIAHEVGHQFSMSHSFNSSIPVCTTREPSTSVEVGSGTTIMSYGYTCSDNTGNDDYESTYLPFLNFHPTSYSQAVNFMTTITSVYTTTSTGNTPPVITAITADKTIPKSTPFFLTGTASDVNTSDVLSYSWEGTNIGTATPVPSTFANTALPPFFRSYQPVSSSTRFYPRLSAILDGSNYARGDKLPSVGIVTTHRFTVRDNVNGINTGTVTVTVDGNSGPFLETTNLSGNYTSGSSQTITWSVNNTTAAPVNCTNVSILLSVDGGQTFPYTLAASTPNDGSEQITFPELTSSTTTARIKVQAVDNIFFDISNSNFSITATLPVSITSITASKKNASISVDWSVLNEINVKKYEVEKSADGISYVKIGEVAATKASNYILVDVLPFSGNNYYRIKSVDNDGSEQFSKSVVVKFGTDNNQNIVVVNNPIVNGKVQLLVENTAKGVYYITLYNQLGQQVAKKEIAHAGNSTTYTFSTNGFAKGVYQVLFTNASDFKVVKTVIVE
jgi:Metallo-peptidase family M12B Reprolysin-like